MKYYNCALPLFKTRDYIFIFFLHLGINELTDLNQIIYNRQDTCFISRYLKSATLIKTLIRDVT